MTDRKAANERAGRRIVAAEPHLEAVEPAATAVPALDGRTLLHSGPPVDWAEMIDPLRGALVGATLSEGWAETESAAVDLLASGTIETAPNTAYGVAAPLAGVVSPSMPVYVVRDHATGATAYTNLNEGLGRVLRFGAYDDEVLERLAWMEQTLGPALGTVLEEAGPIALDPLVAAALERGDECHNRNEAASSLLVDELAPALFRSPVDREVAATVIEFVTDNPHTFLNVSIAAAFTRLQAATGIEGSTVVTRVAANGTEFGVQLSGHEEWATAPAPSPAATYLDGYGPADAAPVVGDSLVTEATGLGGFALAAAPAISDYLGITPARCRTATEEMDAVTVTEHDRFRIPLLDRGTPVGIDAAAVVETGVEPVFNAGIAHTQRGEGQVGAGLARMPLAAFEAALDRAETDDGTGSR
jgi:hypothetical protein